jgi:RNA polymerase sigma-70 factor, ECF subfamily
MKIITFRLENIIIMWYSEFMTSKIESLQIEIFNESYKNFEKGLNVHAFYKLSNHDLGQDLVQETFMKTWKFLVGGGEVEKMKAFLYHILNNLIIDEYRKKKPISLDDLFEKGYEHPDIKYTKSDNHMDGECAMNFISKLPKNYQKIMQMRFVDELSLDEISKITKKSANSIAVTIHRGLKKLKTFCE